MLWQLHTQRAVCFCRGRWHCDKQEAKSTHRDEKLETREEAGRPACLEVSGEHRRSHWRRPRRMGTVPFGPDTLPTAPPAQPVPPSATCPAPSEAVGSGKGILDKIFQRWAVSTLLHSSQQSEQQGREPECLGLARPLPRHRAATSACSAEAGRLTGERGGGFCSIFPTIVTSETGRGKWKEKQLVTPGTSVGLSISSP